MGTTTATTRTQLAYGSVDDYLGPAETRFFGRGFQRAEYQISEVRVQPGREDRPEVRATVSVSYPADWSRKRDNIDLRPHLSTVDMLVLGVQFSEVALLHTYELDEEQRRDLWVRKVTLTAGTTPQEELTGLTGSAVPRETRPAPDSADTQISVFDCAVGVMRARVEIEHPTRQARAATGTYSSLEDVLGAPGLRYYGDGFKLRRQYVENVRVDMMELRATADVRLDPAGSESATRGVDGRYQPSVSLVDCFVTNLQLAQVLMYELDGVPRQESNTLWMLRTVLDAAKPVRPFGEALPTEVAITGKHLVPLRGGTWRNVEIRGGCGGVDLRASFAHELPAAAAAVAR